MDVLAGSGNLKLAGAAAVLVLMFAAIVFSRIHRATIALLAACVILVFHIAPFERLIHHIDANVIMLLAAMMTIVVVIRRTGLFQYIAIKSAKLAGGNPIRLLVFFSVVTAVVSAFFDNVTTVLLMSPITLFVCAEFEVNPVPFLVIQAVTSNFGGTATLIGDPPNIMIGSAAHLSFADFMLNLAPLVAIVIGVYALAMRFLYRRRIGFPSGEVKARVAAMDESKAIVNRKLLRRSMVILFMVLVGFLAAEWLSLESGVVALCGAATLLLVSRADIVKVFEEIDWPTLVFFICLYIVVGACVETGLIRKMGSLLFSIAPENPILLSLMVMWFSAFVSAIVDNVPFTAVMIPMISSFVGVDHKAAFVWWALAIGTCFGGSMTLVGAAANVATAGIAERNGYRISFKTFFMYGAPATVIALIISSIYIYLRYSL
jgi:Na+/H+ antiporter NhaD/arsenite permease-like protein